MRITDEIYSRPARGLKKLAAVASVLFLLYGFFLTFGSEAGFPPTVTGGSFAPSLAGSIFIEDGFYMLTVAWNFASTGTFIYNGGEPTCGVQPLSTLIYGFIAALVRQFDAGKWGFLRAVTAFNVFCLLLFAHLAGLLARRLTFRKESKALSYYFCFIITVFHPSLIRTFLQGLETGIYLTLFLACILLTAKGGYLKKSFSARGFLTGAAIGVTGLARIDFGLVFFFFAVILLIRKAAGVKELLTISIVALLIVSPWFFWVHDITGSWMPTSGAAQMFFSSNSLSSGFLETALERITKMGQALLQHMTFELYPYFRLPFRSAILVIFAAAFYGFIILGRRKERIFEPSVFDAWLCWLLAFLPLIAVYAVLFWADHFYLRYSSPLLIFVVTGVSVLVVERLREPRKILIAASIALVFFLPLQRTYHNGSRSPYAVTAGFLGKFSSSEPAAAWQSGTLGFFHSNVLNLDGKVSAAALELLTDKEKMAAYIDAKNIVRLIDQPVYFSSLLNEDYISREWIPCSPQVDAYKFYCLERKKNREEY